MAAHESLYPLIVPEVLGCPTPTIDSAINRAAADFCRRSGVWRADLDPVVLVADQWRYTLTLPADAVLVSIDAARAGLRLLGPVSDPHGVLPWGQEPGEPTRYALSADESAILVHPAPVAAGSLSVSVVLAPTLGAATLPDLLVNRYYEGVAEGAKAILRRMPGQPWTDVNAAQLAALTARQKADEARVEREWGAARSLSVTPRAFGG